jgi:hypothetical protein
MGVEFAGSWDSELGFVSYGCGVGLCLVCGWIRGLDGGLRELRLRAWETRLGRATRDKRVE